MDTPGRGKVIFVISIHFPLQLGGRPRPLQHVPIYPYTIYTPAKSISLYVSSSYTDNIELTQ